jgi:uncharacterized protein HemY
VAATVTAVALAGGVAVLWVDSLAAESQLETTVAPARRAAEIAPMWSKLPALEAQAYRHDAGTGRDPRAWVDAERAARTAVRRDPSNPSSYFALAQIAVDRGDWVAAGNAFTAALRWNPQSLQASVGAAAIAERNGDRAAVRRHCARAAAVWDDPKCPIVLVPRPEATR